MLFYSMLKTNSFHSTQERKKHFYPISILGKWMKSTRSGKTDQNVASGEVRSQEKVFVATQS